jgi:hypothetical protein
VAGFKGNQRNPSWRSLQEVLGGKIHEDPYPKQVIIILLLPKEFFLGLAGIPGVLTVLFVGLMINVVSKVGDLVKSRRNDGSDCRGNS